MTERTRHGATPEQWPLLRHINQGKTMDSDWENDIEKQLDELHDCVTPWPAAPQQSGGKASPALDCSQLRAPDEAPRDGTKILAAVGWPWLVPAVWCADSESWAVVNVQGEEVGDGVVSMYWESDTERPSNLLGWLPWPDLPGGYVFSPAND